jgi:predicted Zn-dependent protease
VPNFTHKTKEGFNKVSDHVLNSLKGNEEMILSLHAEDSTFVRFNNNQVRQNTHVEQRSIGMTLQKNGRTSIIDFSITGNEHEDTKRALHRLEEARQECELLPEDPYQVAIKNNGTSDTTVTGKLLADEEIFGAITTSAKGADLAGLYCAGPLIAANKNSQGQNHWFANESFFMDYSLYNGEKAAKGVYAGTEWNQNDFAANLATSKNLLALMNKPKVTLKPGPYKTYLAPGAVAEIAGMFSWNALSFSAYKQGHCPFRKLVDKEKTLSPLFSLKENFDLGLNYRFNSLGELAPQNLDLISKGELKTLLISTRSAKEYHVEGNSAESGEWPRSLEMLPGTLQEKDILKELGTGLYLSNLHYINWSDRANARITGMTRYACFWVEHGEIVGPIADMRFDESLYEAFGKNLLAVTDFQEVNPQTGTYEARRFGGSKLPGALIQDFKLTL